MNVNFDMPGWYERVGPSKWQQQPHSISAAAAALQLCEGHLRTVMHNTSRIYSTAPECDALSAMQGVLLRQQQALCSATPPYTGIYIYEPWLLTQAKYATIITEGSRVRFPAAPRS